MNFFINKLIKYCDFGDIDNFFFKIEDWFEHRIVKYSIYNPMYWFLMLCMVVILGVLIIIIQIISYSYYWFCLLRYPYKLYINDILWDGNDKLIKDISEWCVNSKIIFMPFLMFTHDNVLILPYPKIEKLCNIGFKSNVDAMAFKLAWL